MKFQPNQNINRQLNPRSPSENVSSFMIKLGGRYRSKLNPITSTDTSRRLSHLKTVKVAPIESSVKITSVAVYQGLLKRFRKVIAPGKQSPDILESIRNIQKRQNTSNDHCYNQINSPSQPLVDKVQPNLRLSVRKNSPRCASLSTTAARSHQHSLKMIDPTTRTDKSSQTAINSPQPSLHQKVPIQPARSITALATKQLGSSPDAGRKSSLFRIRAKQPTLIEL